MMEVEYLYCDFNNRVYLVRAMIGDSQKYILLISQFGFFKAISNDLNEVLGCGFLSKQKRHEIELHLKIPPTLSNEEIKILDNGT
jgi:hypothetical protein